MYKLPEKFKELLHETADATTHRSLEDWRNAWSACQGIERFLDSLSNRSKWKKICIKEMELPHKQIRGFLDKQWEIEEGWKYDKVGDGIYIKKKGLE